MSNGPPQERPPEAAAGDTTTGAIFQIIHTMGGDGHDEARPSTMAAGGVPDASSSEFSKPPAGDNRDIEDWMIEQGYIARRSSTQRRILGCIGCKLASQPGSSGTVTSREIADCSGMNQGNIHRGILRLIEAGLIISKTERTPGAVGRAPVLFSLTEAGSQSSFKGRLETPDICRLETSKGQTNAESENILIEAGVTTNRSDSVRAILGCLGCRQQAQEGIFITGVEKCQGVNHSAAYNLLSRLAGAGAVEKTIEERTASGRPKAYYRFTESDLAERLKATLETPRQCGLENEEE